jgi:NAD(P)H-hydrate repair Nnr-like enzyme with NAD(P)H-hydrate dehydratase domain
VLTVIGTVPAEDFPLTIGTASLEDGDIVLEGARAPVNRGTPALLAAAIMAAQVVDAPPPRAVLAGDIGLGKGSRAIYAHLEKHLEHDASSALVFHYLQPDVDWHNRVLFALQKNSFRPRLIADAGFMYAAKMSGMAPEYDLFTPDVGELAFLADETAPHPFYTRGFILQEENRTPEYIARAYAHGNAARYLIVKGSRDYLADASGILASREEPSTPAMEAVGGTGDTLTGVAAALVASELDIARAARVAAHANRLAGVRCNPTPASRIMDMIRHIPEAVRQALHELPD